MTSTLDNATVAWEREQINHLDRSIVNLLQERHRRSERLWRARVAAGGSRTDLNQENKVIQRYIDAFGSPRGLHLAYEVLNVCKEGLPE